MCDIGVSTNWSGYLFKNKEHKLLVWWKRPHTSFSADSLQKNCEFMIRYLNKATPDAWYGVGCWLLHRLPLSDKIAFCRGEHLRKIFCASTSFPFSKYFSYPLDDVKIILLLAIHFLNDSAGKNEGSCWNFSKIRICSCKADSNNRIHSVLFVMWIVRFKYGF